MPPAIIIRPPPGLYDLFSSFYFHVDSKPLSAAEWMDGWNGWWSDRALSLLLHAPVCLLSVSVCFACTSHRLQVSHMNPTALLKTLLPHSFFPPLCICMDPCRLTYRRCTHASKMRTKKQRSSLIFLLSLSSIVCAYVFFFFSFFSFSLIYRLDWFTFSFPLFLPSTSLLSLCCRCRLWCVCMFVWAVFGYIIIYYCLLSVIRYSILFAIDNHRVVHSQSTSAPFPTRNVYV